MEKRSSTHRIYSICGGDNARVEEESEEFNSHIHPEKHDNFFATNSGVLAPDVQDHDGRHDDCDNVHETGCWAGLAAGS